MIPKQILDKTRIDMQDVADIAAMTGVSKTFKFFIIFLTPC